MTDHEPTSADTMTGEAAEKIGAGEHEQTRELEEQEHGQPEPAQAEDAEPGDAGAPDDPGEPDDQPA